MAKRNKKEMSQTRRNEAFGVILFGLGVFLLLSLLTYNQADNPNLEIDNNSIKIKNLLGPTGAAIAQPLMNYTLGYPIIVLPIIIILLGYRLYRQIPLLQSTKLIVSLVLWSVLISIILAIPEAFETYGKIKEYYPSGLVGGEIASFLTLYLGKFGSIFVITILALSLIISHVKLHVSEIFGVVANFGLKIVDFIKDSFQSLMRIRKQRKIEKSKYRLEKRRSKISKIKKKREIRTEIEPEKPVFGNDEDDVVIKTKIVNNTDPGPVAEVENDEEDGVKIIKKKPVVVPQNEETQNNESEEMDFEVKEEAKVEEVDYDQLVRQSVAKYEFPPIELLDSKPVSETGVTKEELKYNADLLESKLLDFGVKVKVVRVTAGPVITLYELQPDTGVKVRQVVSLADDLALAMEAKGMRMIAPIPGKAAIGIEIPNKNPQMVYLKPLIRSETFTQSEFILPLVLGKTINGEVYCADLTKMPHLLIAGATGSGKSVGINTVITSLLYSVDPGKVKFVMVDPKKIELSLYKDMRDHFLIWRTDLDEEVITKASNAISILNSLTLEMERRYDKLAHLGVRNIEEYNNRVKLGGPRIKEEKLQQIPYIVLIVDELADMMMMAAKEVEIPIARLAQMARAVGIHLILATQRPSVDVITGVIKANFPARIAYMVTTRPDSKTILDMNGAEKLLGKGDMLYQPPGEPRPIRLQNPIITTEEVKRIIKHVKKQPKLPHYSLPQPSDSPKGDFNLGNGSQDSMYEKAKELVITSQQGSISYLQRRLKIGYSRAARLIDDMEEEGIVGPAEGGKPRQVYYLPEDM